jgi:hypothetical protein
MLRSKIVHAIILSPFLLGALFISPAGAQVAPPPGPVMNFDQAVNRAISNEHKLIEKLKDKQPVVETYLQELKSDPDFGTVPEHDFYFLGKLSLTNGLQDASLVPISAIKSTLRAVIAPVVVWNDFFARGFASRIFIDQQFDRAHYKFQYVKREFLGDVRCIVIDVVPQKGAGHGRFDGRIWVEDRDYNVVRFNGTYGAVRSGYLHFDSWRVNTVPHLWLPAYIYTEEASYQSGPFKSSMVKGQTRLWNYVSQKNQTDETFTNVSVDMQQPVKDQSAAAAEPSPIEAQRMWQRQAEDNIIDRLQRAGLVSPAGEVDKVLETVVNNLEVTNNLNIEPPVRVRIMPTTPLESVAVGHTIVISRGLIDVLPDEACLAATLSHELAHIVLGHTVNTAYAFEDRLMFDDKAALSDVAIARTDQEEEAADKKAIELLKNSPYKDKLPRVGVFLRMLSARSEQLPHLIRPLLGNRVADTHQDLRLAALMEVAPELQMRDTGQIAALPLGSRVKMDPWSDQLYLMKTHNVALASAKEKLPFEITPFMLHLTREDETAAVPPSNAEITANVAGTKH